MYQITREQVRPNTDVDFFSIVKLAPDIAEYWHEKFILTKKIISNKHTLSEDKLTMTTVSQWASKDDFYDMISDPYLNETLFDMQREYNKYHNITRIFKDIVEL